MQPTSDSCREGLPENAQVTISEDAWRLSSDSPDRLTPEEQKSLDALGSWIGGRMSRIRLPDPQLSSLVLEVDPTNGKARSIEWLGLIR